MFLRSKSLSTVILILHLVPSQSYKEKSFSTSISGDLVQLLETEMYLIDSVERYALALQRKVDILVNLVLELKEENQKSENKREEYLFNPLNGYALIRRMYSDWPKIELFMTQATGKEHVAAIRYYRPQMPTAIDFVEASQAINRLQIVYDLKADDLVQGLINGRQYEVKLKSIDAYFMGYHLFSKRLYYAAGFWLYSSIVNYEQTYELNKILNFGKEKPLKLYAETLAAQNLPKAALSFITQASNLQPLDVYLLNRKNEIQLLANTNNNEPLQHPTPHISNYERGCRGDFSNHSSKLYCLYNTASTAFLQLAPIKTEIINHQPYMVVMHDVLFQHEMEHLINVATPNLERAAVFDHENEVILVSEERTSKYVWLNDNLDEITKRINQRIIDITGFDIVDSEVLQMVNYGLGGHYEVHYDFFNVTDLTDVEQGGATVFPILKTAIFPRKGSAVMWYNLNNKLEMDELTMHAACPVLVGSKWVCTKWIRAKAQMFKRPCYK